MVIHGLTTSWSILSIFINGNVHRSFYDPEMPARRGGAPYEMRGLGNQ
jgi:hypothetical protein